MGATEGFAASIRALTAPGDAVAFFQPFHELYPSQLAIFGLEARAVTLSAGFDRWSFDPAELDRALRGAKLFLFNDPHNPTGPRPAWRWFRRRENQPKRSSSRRARRPQATASASRRGRRSRGSARSTASSASRTKFTNT